MSEVCLADLDLTTKMEIIKTLLATLCLALALQGLSPAALPYMVIDGDLYIVAVFALTEKGCTDIRTNSGYQYTDAVALALKRINSQKGQFANLGVKIGAVIMDDCKDGARAVKMVRDWYSGDMNITDKNGTNIIPSMVVGFIASSNSGKTIQLADYLKTKMTAIVAPFASSPQLSDRTRFPYFIRTIPSDDKQGPALADMLIRVGWFNVHIVIEEGSTYATDLEFQFSRSFTNKDKGGCISTKQIFKIGPNSSNAEAIILAIAGSTSKADIVVVLGRSHVVRSLLEAKQLHIADARVKCLVFVGSEAWGKSEHVVEDYEDAAEGAISISLYGDNVAAFDAYMSTLRYNGHSSNPYFDMFFEAMYDCKPAECPTDKSVTDLPHYSQSTYVKHVMNAMYALSIATIQKPTEKCRKQAKAVCPKFGTAFGEDITKILENMSFTDVNGQNFEIRDRESVNGYDFYYWENDGTPRKIGELTADGTFQEKDAMCFPKGFYENSLPESKCPDSTCEYYCKDCNSGRKLLSKCKDCRQRERKGYKKCAACVLNGKTCSTFICFNCMK